jgi:hypothetical protein
MLFLLQMTAHRHLNSDQKNLSTTHGLFGPPKPAAGRPLQHRDKETQKLSVGPGSTINGVCLVCLMGNMDNQHFWIQSIKNLRMNLLWCQQKMGFIHDLSQK